MHIIGIDVGGTNTDAALIKNARVLAMSKTPTRHRDLFSSTSTALEQVLRDYGGPGRGELHLSTTLSTNLIAEGKGAPATVLAVPGPGVNLSSYRFPFTLHELDGYIDHRGREVHPLDLGQVRDLKPILQRDAQALGLAGKFSNRNPRQEQQLYGELSPDYPGVISCGHRLSGKSNFPRRIMTSYLNSSVAAAHLEFVAMWQKLIAQRGMELERILILKADGGTMSLEASRERPIETILSGPAASIMGVRALTGREEDNYVIIDIGGTTTDLAAVVQRQVLFERDGATISGYKTLVPALLVRSLGLGGDSSIGYDQKRKMFSIGPRRAGTPVCLGGEQLTPTDAVVALDLAAVGEKERAVHFWQKWAEAIGLKWQQLASGVVDAFLRQLQQAVEDLYGELENQPLYTVSQILTPPRVRPEAVVGLGAPAPCFIPKLAARLALPWEVVPYSSGANAIGAAAARATAGITLHADTEQGVVTIPEMSYRAKLKRPLFFDLPKARVLAERKTEEFAVSQGYPGGKPIYISEEESFHLVRGFRTVGKIHMIRTQLRPAVRRIEGGE